MKKTDSKQNIKPDVKPQTKKRRKENQISSTVTMHCYFYRDQYRRLVFTTGLVLLANLFCALVIVFILLDKPADIYIPAEEVNTQEANLSATNLAITPRIPLDKPNMQEMELVQWIYTAINNSFTYNLQTYVAERNNNKQYYTDNGWREYNTIYNNMVELDKLRAQETLISILNPDEAPTPYNTELDDDGVYTWVYDFPVTVDFFGTIEVPTQKMTLRITVIRTSMANDTDGVKIARIEALDIRKINSFGRVSNIGGLT